MHDPRTIARGDEVASDDAEGIPIGTHPGEELLIARTYEVLTLPLADDDVGELLVARLIGCECLFTFVLLAEERVQECTSYHSRDRRTRIGVEGADGHVVDLRTDAESRIRGQRPGGRRPSEEDGFTMARQLGTWVDDAELCDARRVLHITITPGLIQLVRTQPRTCSRRIGLDRVALIEEALLIDLAEEVPEGLDIAVVVGDVGVIHVHPVAHEAGELLPLLRVLHHLTATSSIVFVDADLLADIFLRDTEGLLDPELYGQTVGIPAGLTVDAESLHRLVAAEDILDRARHDVVNTRHPVSRGRPFVEDERGRAFAQGKRAGKEVFLLPLIQHLLIDPRELEVIVFRELMAHTASILYRRREERRAECGYTPSQGSSKIDTKIQLSIDADSMHLYTKHAYPSPPSKEAPP